MPPPSSPDEQRPASERRDDSDEDFYLEPPNFEIEHFSHEDKLKMNGSHFHAWTHMTLLIPRTRKIYIAIRREEWPNLTNRTIRRKWDYITNYALAQIALNIEPILLNHLPIECAADLREVLEKRFKRVDVYSTARVIKLIHLTKISIKDSFEDHMAKLWVLRQQRIDAVARDYSDLEWNAAIIGTLTQTST